jgi:hypothetical protein
VHWPGLDNNKVVKKAELWLLTLFVSLTAHMQLNKSKEKWKIPTRKMARNSNNNICCPPDFSVVVGYHRKII